MFKGLRMLSVGWSAVGWGDIKYILEVRKNIYISESDQQTNYLQISQKSF